MLAAALPAAPHSASADAGAPHRSGVELRSRLALGSCMDANAAGGGVILWSCHGGSNQRFAYLDDGTLRQGGRCVGANGAALVLKRCDASPDTRWTFAGGEIRNAAQQCIDIAGGERANGTPLVAWSCHGAMQQQWTRR
jgi:streptogrisin C